MYLSRGLSFTVAGNPSITSIIHVLNSYIYFFKINENNMPMGNITHLRHSSNQEIHLHKVIILLIHNHNVDWEKKKFISILRKKWSLFTTRVPFYPRCFVPSFVETAQVVLEKILTIYFVNVFSLFQLLSPLRKCWVSLFEQTGIPFTQGCFVPSWNQSIWFWRRRQKCEKFTDRQMDKWQAIRKAPLSF